MDETKHDPSAGPPPYAAQPQAAPYPNQPPQQNMYQQGAPPQYPQGGYPAGSYPQGQPYGGYPPTSYGQQSTVIVSQPGGYIAGAGIVAAPPNHMALSILTCLFCFWPLGLVAIIKSNEVDSAVRRGDLAAASEASQSARRFSMWSIGCGIAAYILVVVIVVIQVAVVSSTYNSRY